MKQVLFMCIDQNRDPQFGVLVSDSEYKSHHAMVYKLFNLDSNQLYLNYNRHFSLIAVKTNGMQLYICYNFT